LVKWYAHIVLGVGASLALINPEVTRIFMVGTSATIGSLLPDLDLNSAHRRLLHNFWALIMIVLIMTLIFKAFHMLSKDIIINIIAPVSIGYILHIIGDSFTKMGVWPLWPLKKPHISLSEYEYDHPVINIFVASIGFLLCIVYLYSYLKQFIHVLFEVL